MSGAETDKDYRIGVCHRCDRYGQISKDENAACIVAPPPSWFNVVQLKDHFRRVETCRRIVAKRYAKANR